MKKSTYSVVLSDRVVAEIDRLAYRKGTNRSSMINEILAGYVSMTTPEQRISRIFSDMAAVLYPGEVFRELAPPTPSVMSMRAALAYKYNPTVRYTVELFRDPGATHGGAQGIIRVSVRTTSVALLTERMTAPLPPRSPGCTPPTLPKTARSCSGTEEAQARIFPQNYLPRERRYLDI